MKFLKVLALILTVCLLGTMFVACDSGKDEETTAATKVTITLKVKAGAADKYEDTIECDGTLANAIEILCAGEGAEEGVELFDSNGMLATVVDLTAKDGKIWTAYYENEGKSKAFASIKDATVEDGRTVVLVLE